jgi:hypothetical protein
MIDSSVALVVGFICGVPCDIDFRGSYYFGSVDKLSGDRVCVGNCLLRFRSEMDCRDASALIKQKLDDIQGFTRFYVTWGTTPFVQLEKFMIISLRMGSEEKVVERSLFSLMLKMLGLFRVCNYYRMLVGASKRSRNLGSWG